MRNGLNPEESKASQITDKAIFRELLLTPAQGDWGVLEAAVTGPEAGVPTLKQIHHKLLKPHIWRQFSVSSKPNGSAAMAGNWIIRSSVGKKELAQSYTHRPGDRNLKQNLIAMRQWGGCCAAPSATWDIWVSVCKCATCKYPKCHLWGAPAGVRCSREEKH